MSDPPVETSIAPWLAVSDGAGAVQLYAEALGAIEVYRLDGDDGEVVVAQLTVDGATFWVQEDRESRPGPRASRPSAGSSR